jgi:hypothetical protein
VIIRPALFFVRLLSQRQVPTILTTVETESFSGYMWPEILDVFPNQDVLAGLKQKSSPNKP